MGKMTTMQKIQFITAWVVAGAAVLSLILQAVALRGSALWATGTAFDIMFVGITACFALLYLSGWFTSSLVLFILAWVVAGLAVLALILNMAATVNGPYTAGTFFWHLGFGAFCTLLLLHCSGKFK